MPDLLLLTWSFIAAAGSSGGCFAAGRLLSAAIRGRASTCPGAASETMASMAIALGIGVGLIIQGHIPAVPPGSALDRCLVLLLPAFTGVELLAGRFRNRPRLAVSSRVLLAAFVPGVLLFQSVHIGMVDGRGLLQIPAEGVMLLSLCCVIAVSATVSLQFSSPLPPLVRAVACTGTLHCAGILIMLGGWIRGGAAVLPMTGAICGVLGACCFVGEPRVSAAAGRWAGWCLLNMVFCGHFFGRLSGVDSAALLLTVFAIPLIVVCLPPGHRRRGSALVLLSTVIVTGVLLWFAWVRFSERMRPLMATVNTTKSDSSVGDQVGHDRQA